MAHTRDGVVEAALRVLDTHGLEFCTMRRIAGALDITPGALYHHVPDKQTLLGLMADRIVEDVEVDADLRATCHRLRAAMLSVRDGAEVVATAVAFRLGRFGVEDALARMSSADLARTLLLYVVGHTQMTQLHRQAASLGIVETDADLDDSFDRGLAIIVD